MPKNDVRLSKNEAEVIRKMRLPNMTPKFIGGSYWLEDLRLSLDCIKDMEHNGLIVWGASEYELTELGKQVNIA